MSIQTRIVKLEQAVTELPQKIIVIRPFDPEPSQADLDQLSSEYELLVIRLVRGLKPTPGDATLYPDENSRPEWYPLRS
jgi:hypothetical protein